VPSFTVANICERHGVSPHTVLSWIKTGELRAFSVARQPGAKRPSWRISPEALAAFEARRTPTQETARTRRRARPAGVVEFY
jgi:hypothetical protein